MKRSRRAKSFRISFDRHNQLQIVYPYFSNKKTAIEFLNQQRPWVEQQLARLEHSAQSDALPLYIHLAAIDRSWYVHYIKTKAQSVRVIEKADSLILTGNIAAADLSRLALRRFIARKAKEHLTDMLDQLVVITQIDYVAVQYRAQHSLWGSCSRTGNLSINMKLLFFPSRWVDYVLVHELCHRKYFNHSKQFWDLVASFQPEYKAIKKEMQQADRRIPGWFI